MILILLASIYITILCWCWGLILFKLLQVITREHVDIKTNFIVTCFSGLALTGIVFSFLSLFLPLGNLTAHICLVLPAITYWIFYRNHFPFFTLQLITARKHLKPAVVILLLSGTALVLIMGASTIKHPDTLHYHVQCIKWIQDYKVIPGLANLGYHYGLQSSWFILSALFSFKFTGFTSFNALNCTVIFWLIYFIGFKINECLRSKTSRSSQIFAGIMWLLLFIFSFWSYTQIRLTATSASPDFIAALYIWLIFFLILFPVESRLANSRLLLLVFLSLFVITIKLSSLPVILLTLYYYHRTIIERKTVYIQLVVCTIVVLAPAIIRNFITTGYPLFPSALGDFFNVDWKIPKELVYARLDYIKAYARVEDTGGIKNISIAASMNFNQWIPIWWNNQSMADKILLASLPVLVSGNLLLIKRMKWISLTPYFPALTVCFAGLSFWLFQAPDPRFGFGFIIVCAGILMYFISTCFIHAIEFNMNWLRAPLLVFAAILTFYSIYRVANFFKLKDLVIPAGIAKLPFKTISCHGIEVNVPVDGLGCGDNDLPCIYENCGEFVLRGNTINDGFKPARK